MQIFRKSKIKKHLQLHTMHFNITAVSGSWLQLNESNDFKLEGYDINL